MTEADIGWEDVLRRARRRPRARWAAVAVVAVAALGGAPALAVLLTRPDQPALPRDQIVGSVAVVMDPVTGNTLLEYARWKGHDGACYLVPHVRAGCLRTGQRSPRFLSLPMLMVRRRQARPHRFVLTPRVGFRVVALPGGRAKIVSGSAAR